MKFVTLSLLSLVLSGSAKAAVEVYPGAGAYQSNLYTVEVQDGSQWLPSYTYQLSRVSRTFWHNGSQPSVNFTTFGTTGSAQVRISKLSGAITTVQVSPKSKSIPVQISNGKAILTLSQNHKAWITVNGDDANPLFVFADEPKPPIPACATYFGPGVRDLSPANGNHYKASDNEVIYIDGGAWLRGTFDLRGVSNVQIMGPGVLSGDLWDPAIIQQLPWESVQDYFMIRAECCLGNTARVRGITVVDSPVQNLTGLTSVYSVKLLAPWFNAIGGFTAVDVDQSFAFLGDTVFHLDAAFWSSITNSYSVNTRVANSFAGNAGNSIILGGYWGNYPSATFSALAENLDLRSYNSDEWEQYGAATTPAAFQIWLDNTDPTFGYSNQTYRNIRIEGNLKAPLAQLKNFVYPWAGGPNPPLGNSYNLKFENITLEGTQKGLSQMLGYDGSNGFHNVTWDNLKINGTLVTEANKGNYFAINSYVTNLKFLPLGDPTTIPQSQMSVHSASLSGGSAVLDGNTGTRWLMSSVPPAREIVLALGGTYAVTKLIYTETWSRVGNYAVYVSSNPNGWDVPVSTGVMPSNGEISFPAKTGSYLRFVALDSPNGYAYASELNVVRQ